MTSVNIMDVSPSKGYPVNPYSKIDKSEGSAKDDFMSLMAGSMNPAAINAGNISSVNNNPDLNSAIETNVSDNSTVNFTNSVSKDRVSNEPVKTVEVEDVKEAIGDFTKDVKETLIEELDITEEELEEAMETLGLSFVDLTQPGNLAALLNEIKGGEDSVGLLLDTSVKEVFDEMSVLTGELFEETGLDTEGLIAVMEMEPVQEETTLPLMAEGGEVAIPVETEVAGEAVASAGVQEAVNMATETNGSESPVKEEAETKDTVIVNNSETKPVRENQAPIDRETANMDTEDESAVSALNSKVVQNNSQSSGQNSANQGTFQNNSQANTQAAQTNINLANMNEQVVSNEPQPTFAQAMANVDAPVEVPVYTTVNPADVINQIVTQAQTTITENVRSMELELNPHNLGRMFMQVSENEGQITARFVTQNESVRAALEGAITNLLDRLNEQGIKVNAVEVSVGTHEFEQNLEQNFAGNAREDMNQSANEAAANQSGQGNRRRGGIHLGDPGYMEGAELTEEEELTASIMRTYGNTVNFTA